MSSIPSDSSVTPPNTTSPSDGSVEYIRIGDLPQSFLDKVMYEFTPYSIGLARVRDEMLENFTPIGSGALVKRGGKYGILTARHCTHACYPQLSIGSHGRDTLYICLRNGRTATLAPNILFESSTTTPECDEYGPDLTFIEILPSEQLQSLLAISSAWNMDGPSKEMLDEYSSDGVMICALGYPEELCRTQIQVEKHNVHRVAKHMTYINVLEEGDRSERNGWDYIDIKMAYEEPGRLPDSFQGMSGGPVWALKARRDKATGEIMIVKSCLVGVVFYQSALVDNVRHLRAHFARSVYINMWQQG